MRVGLFIHCYMDAFEPEVGVATLELLEQFGCQVEYPFINLLRAAYDK